MKVLTILLDGTVEEVDLEALVAPPPSLTPRERQVLAGVAERKPNATIADELGLSPKTVKTHLSDVLKQLGVANRTQAALAAHRFIGR